MGVEKGKVREKERGMRDETGERRGARWNGEKKREVEGVRREIKRGRRADKKRGTGWSGVENRGKRVALEGERGVRERERERRTAAA